MSSSVTTESLPIPHAGPESRVSSLRLGNPLFHYGRSRPQNGFTLLEVVVAFAILALALGLLIQIFSRTWSTTALSGDYFRAATLAQTRLNAVGVDIPLELGSYSGDPQDGLSWQVLIEPYPLGDLAWEPTFDTFLVTSVISWGEESDKARRISLSTLRLASSSDAPGLVSEGGLTSGIRSDRDSSRQGADEP